MLKGNAFTVAIAAAVTAVLLLVGIISALSYSNSGHEIAVLAEDPSKESYTPVYKQFSAGNWSAYVSAGTLYVTYIDKDESFKFLVTCTYRCTATSSRLGYFFVESSRDTPLSSVFDLVVNEKYHALVKYVNGMYTIAIPSE